MKLIIFTYPVHYKLSLVVEKFALLNLPEVTEVIFAWDDLAPDPFNYKDRLIKTKNVIMYSEFPDTVDEPIGWLRQQYVKLQLHHKLSDHAWILLDGDFIIREKIKLRSKSTFITCAEHYPLYFEFIERCLGLKKQNDFSFIFPLNIFERDVLIALEEYSLKRNNQTVIEYYKTVSPSMDRAIPCFSEFEIYGTFATQILNRNYNFILKGVIYTDKIYSSFKNIKHNLVLTTPHPELSDNEFRNLIVEAHRKKVLTNRNKTK